MFKRLLEKTILRNLFTGKVIIVSGARQVGKTTLIESVLNKQSTKEKHIRIFNCDEKTDQDILSRNERVYLEKIIGNAKIIFIDEGQKVQNIGETLKLLVDYYKDKKQIIVTGSSRVHLLTETQEPLTGRKTVKNLYPLSLEEIYLTKDLLLLKKELEFLLVYGCYPEVLGKSTFNEKQDVLIEIKESYLYKDVFEFQEVRKPSVIQNLLKAIAFQIGSEVSYHELGTLLGVSRITVERYVDLLEKNNIVFRHYPYATNKRKEISKMHKIYFYDVGIRNAIINNFNLIQNRADIGQIWENFVVAERIKYQEYHNIHSNNYFWRSYNGAEVDFIEEREGKLFGYEIKWKLRGKSMKAPPLWEQYKDSEYTIIHPENMDEFLL